MAVDNGVGLLLVSNQITTCAIVLMPAERDAVKSESVSVTTLGLPHLPQAPSCEINVFVPQS